MYEQLKEGGTCCYDTRRDITDCQANLVQYGYGSGNSGWQEGGNLMRKNLKDARTVAGLTQQQVADKIGISLRYYQNIEQGNRTGDFEIWDNLEDLFNIHQRKLREISDNHPDKEDNR